jgi:hypothetical protein
MTIVNLIAALALMGGLWVVIVKTLAASVRRTERLDAAALSPTESAPANRPRYAPPNRSGAANVRVVGLGSATKDLHA